MTDDATQSAIKEAVRVEKPVVTNATVGNMTRRAALFAVAFLLLNFAEEALKQIDIPGEWALSITTLASGVIFILRQWFLFEQQQKGN
jgi:hypothetical protein